MIAWEKLVENHTELVDLDISPERFTFMQFTGLSDRLGKEIYEGDIIEHGDNKYIVPNFIPLDRSYEAESIKPNQDGSDDWMSMSDVDWEIIGSIYENPELIIN